MKIAFVISTFPPKVGGMGQVAFEEAKRLSESGHEITVFTLSYSDSKFVNKNFKVVQMRSLRIGDAGYAPQLFFYLKGFDLVHLHYPFYGADFVVLLAKLIWKIRYVVTYHMDAKPVGFLKNSIKFFSDNIFGKLVLAKANKIIVVDDKKKSQFSLLSSISDDKIAIVPNSVDSDIFCPTQVSANELGLRKLENKKILLFVGNLLAVKRLDLVILAMHELQNEDLVLLVVGGGYQESEYKQLAVKLNLSDQIYFLGKINEKKLMAKYYSLSDITVVPSDYESFSLVATESLSCGTPVIASRIPGLVGRVEDNKDGLFFKNGDFHDLANKINLFFGFSEKEQLNFGEDARQKMINSYTWSQHVDDLLKVYHGL